MSELVDSVIIDPELAENDASGVLGKMADIEINLKEKGLLVTTILRKEFGYQILDVYLGENAKLDEPRHLEVKQTVDSILGEYAFWNYVNYVVYNSNELIGQGLYSYFNDRIFSPELKAKEARSCFKRNTFKYSAVVGSLPDDTEALVFEAGDDYVNHDNLKRNCRKLINARVFPVDRPEDQKEE